MKLTQIEMDAVEDALFVECSAAKVKKDYPARLRVWRKLCSVVLDKGCDCPECMKSSMKVNE
jgi:hypothetical protein